MSFPRYECYKDSEVEWLGEVPEHWKLTPFYSVATEREEPNIGMLEDNLLSLSYGRIVQKDISSNDGLLPESFETYQIVRPGDIIFRLTDLQNDKRSLRTAIVEDTGIITSAYIAAKPINIESGYLSQLLRAYDVKKVFYSMGGGLRQSMKFSDLKRLPTLLPPPEEQSAIAAFLDRETAKIDTLVAEQQRLIELLKEKRQAIISHAVTKGLNPDVPMKDSGVEWLGEVPKHWEIRTIAKLSIKITNGYVGPTRDILVETGVPYIQATHIKGGCINFDGEYFVTEEWSRAHTKSILAKEDVLIVQTGAGTGDVGLVSENEIGFNCHALIIVSPNRLLINGAYLAAILQSTYGRQKLISIQTGAMHPHLNCGEIKFVEVPLPPLSEQEDINAHICETTNQFDALTTEAQRAITLLQERRTALISAAVSGKIKVTGIAE